MRDQTWELGPRAGDGLSVSNARQRPLLNPVYTDSDIELMLMNQTEASWAGAREGWAGK